jgi:hypothetical protein
MSFVGSQPVPFFAMALGPMTVAKRRRGCSTVNGGLAFQAGRSCRIPIVTRFHRRHINAILLRYSPRRPRRMNPNEGLPGIVLRVSKSRVSPSPSSAVDNRPVLTRNLHQLLQILDPRIGGFVADQYEVSTEAENSEFLSSSSSISIQANVHRYYPGTGIMLFLSSNDDVTERMP